MTQENNKSNKKVLIGMVVSDKMDKTIVVRVSKMQMHNKYPKLVQHSKKYKAHDEKEEAKIGDKVKIIQSKPISKEKRWALVEIVEKAK